MSKITMFVTSNTLCCIFTSKVLNDIPDTNIRAREKSKEPKSEKDQILYEPYLRALSS